MNTRHGSTLRWGIWSISALGLLCLSSAGRADTYFTNSATVNASVSGNAVVGYPDQASVAAHTNGASPTVDFRTGSSLVVTNTLSNYNSSIVNVNGGALGNFLYAFDTSSVNMNSGSIAGNLLAYNSTAITITGGGIGVSVAAHDTSAVTISGGTVGNNGIGNGLTAGDFSVINLNGGSVRGTLNASSLSQFNIGGGTVSSLVSGYNNSTINFNGGSFPGGLRALDLTVFNFYGMGLGDTLVNPNNNGFSQYALFGALTDGSDITGTNLLVQNAGSPSINFINAPSTPEPGSLALLVALGTGGAALLSRRR